MRILPELTADQRLAVLAAARSFLGVPYRHRGRNRNGIDCIGLPFVSLASIGVTAQDRRFYSPQPDGVTLRAALVDHLGPPVWRKGEPLDGLQPGDLVLMRWDQHPAHVALVTDYFLGGLGLIHSYADAKCVVEHRLDAPWLACTREGWRL